MKPLRFMGVVLSLLLVLPLAATPAQGAQEGSGSTLDQSSGGGAAAAQNQIIKIRRQIKELLLNAALTTSEMSEAFGNLESFVQNYTLGASGGDQEVLSIGLDYYLERKVRPTLRSFGLKPAESRHVENLLRSWIDAELKAAPNRAGY